MQCSCLPNRNGVTLSDRYSRAACFCPSRVLVRWKRGAFFLFSLLELPAAREPCVRGVWLWRCRVVSVCVVSIYEVANVINCPGSADGRALLRPTEPPSACL